MAEPSSSTAETPIDLPTGEPIPSGSPPDASSSPSTTSPSSNNNSSSSKKTNNNHATLSPRAATTLRAATALLALPAARADAFLAHLQRCLATPAGVDTLLLFVCYTSRLSAAVLAALSRALLRRSARDLVALAFTLPPKTAILFTATTTSKDASKDVSNAAAARLAALVAARLKNLGSLASEARTIARLWALVGMYFWAKRLVLPLLPSSPSTTTTTTKQEQEKETEKPSSSTTNKTLVTLVDWAQFLSCAAFQVLENGAYLSGRGVLGWTPQQQGRAYMVGSRWLAVYTGLELGKLLAKLVASKSKSKSSQKGEQGALESEDEEERAQVEAVRRSMAINLAWTPLTLHWSTEKGLIGDGWIGLGGCIPGIIQMRKLWKETAQ